MYAEFYAYAFKNRLLLPGMPEKPCFNVFNMKYVSDTDDFIRKTIFTDRTSDNKSNHTYIKTYFIIYYKILQDRFWLFFIFFKQNRLKYPNNLKQKSSHVKCCQNALKNKYLCVLCAIRERK